MKALDDDRIVWYIISIYLDLKLAYIKMTDDLYSLGVFDLERR